MRTEIQKRISTAYFLLCRAIHDGDETDSYMYGQVLGRYGLHWIETFPEIYNYPEGYRPMYEQKLLATKRGKI